MPLTIAHPAIVIPFRKFGDGWFSVSALIIGSMSPDFEYLITFQLQDKIAHSSIGVLFFCLPIGLLIYCLYHGIIRVKLIQNLPMILKSRFVYAENFEWKKYLQQRWFIVLYSLIIGAFSHLFWDSFTHDHRFFVEQIPILKSKIAGFPVYKIVQHGSTFVGLLVILLAVYRLPRVTTKANESKWKYWLVFLMVIVVTFLVRLNDGLSLKQLGSCIVTLFSGIFLGLLIASIFSIITEKTIKHECN
jgi:hypothetical protein